MPISHPRLAARGRVGAVAGVAGAIALLLTGCVGASEPTPTPTPTDVTIAPIFATDEEALAAAVAAYEKYRETSAAISTDGGAGRDRVEPYVSEAFLPTVLDEFEALEASGLRMIGTTSIDTASLVSSSSGSGTAEVSIYLCRDVSQARAVNAAGDDVTPTNRDDRVPLQAFLVSGNDDPKVLVVDGVEQWNGDDFC